MGLFSFSRKSLIIKKEGTLTTKLTSQKTEIHERTGHPFPVYGNVLNNFFPFFLDKIIVKIYANLLEKDSN